MRPSVTETEGLLFRSVTPAVGAEDFDGFDFEDDEDTDGGGLDDARRRRLAAAARFGYDASSPSAVDGSHSSVLPRSTVERRFWVRFSCVNDFGGRAWDAFACFSGCVCFVSALEEVEAALGGIVSAKLTRLRRLPGRAAALVAVVALEVVAVALRALADFTGLRRVAGGTLPERTRPPRPAIVAARDAVSVALDKASEGGDDDDDD